MRKVVSRGRQIPYALSKATEPRDWQWLTESPLSGHKHITVDIFSEWRRQYPGLL